MRKYIFLMAGLFLLVTFNCYGKDTGLIFGDEDLSPIYSKDYSNKVSQPPATLKKKEEVKNPIKKQEKEILPKPTSLKIKEPSFEYRVKRGDTLSGIAIRYSTTVARIKEINNLKTCLIRANQKLLIPGEKKERIKEPVYLTEKIKIKEKTPLVEEVLSSKEGKALLKLQTAIVVQKKSNELTQLKVDELKMTLEKKKIKDEIEGKIVTTQQKNQTRSGSLFPPPPGVGQTYIPSSGTNLSQSTPQKEKGFRVLMISSYSGGKRALVRDEGRTFYVRTGDKVSKGKIEDITSSGLVIGSKLYPVSS